MFKMIIEKMSSKNEETHTTQYKMCLVSKNVQHHSFGLF